MAQVPIYVLAGQSNAVHPSVLESLDDALAAISPPFVLRQVAVTGTSLAPSNTVRGDWNVESEGELFDQLVATIADAFAQAIAAGDTPYLGGVFWVQGEADARLAAYAADYEANLTAFIGALRGEFGGDFPFVIAEIRTTDPTYPFHETVRQTQHELAASEPNVLLLETEAFPLVDDGVHYDYLGQWLLGKALARTLLAPGLEKTGTAAADRLDGAALDDALFGLAGVDRLRGLAGDDRLEGADGNDTLDGGAGADLMIGGIGNDTYQVDHADDVVIELEGAGVDRVNSSVSTSLAVNIERLTLIGSADIDGGGNTLANIITGNGGANALAGKAGADRLLGQGGDDALSGGAGKDTLTGGAGMDGFFFNVAAGALDADRIVDFSHSDDTIWLAGGVFGGLPEGEVSASAFTVGLNAASAAHRIIYDPSSGKVYYDADGAGGAAKQLFATLTGRPADLDHTDFLVT